MYHISVISTTPESNRIAKPNLIPFQTELNKLCAIWLALPSPYLIFQKGVVFLSPFEPQPQIKKPHKARKYRLCREKYAIQTLPEDFIIGSQMLVFPTLLVSLFLKILLFSHRFKSF